MTPRTVPEQLPFNARRDPGGAALIGTDRRLDHRALAAEVEAVAGGLAGMGLGAGERVAVELPNDAGAAIAIHSVLRSGAAVVPLKPGMAGARRRAILDELAPAAIIDEGEARSSDRAPSYGLAELRAAGEGRPSPDAPREDDLAAILYTSGSSGRPKGVMMSHGNLYFATNSIVEYLSITAADRILCALQLSYSYGLSQLLCCANAGATLVPLPGFSLPGEVIGALRREAITILPGVAAMFALLVARPGSEGSAPGLRLLTNAGGPLPVPMGLRLRQAFPGAEICAMYGLTECIRASYLPPEELERHPTSSGYPIPGTEAWPETAEGERAAAGEVGELIIRGAHVMQGYWRGEGERPDVGSGLRTGRGPGERELATGDLFRCDAEGRLHWMGRVDDQINSGGEKIYPREIEDVLHDLEGVGEAAVVGVPHRLLGSAVHAHVAPVRGRDLDRDTLRRNCAERLEPSRVPRGFTIHPDGLPRTQRDKIDRRALTAAPFLAEEESASGNGVAN